MFIFDLTNLFSLALIVAAVILFIFLSQEIKNSIVMLFPLFGFLIDLTIHFIQILTLKPQYSYLYRTLVINLGIDYVFLLICFLAYLWADTVEAKAKNKKILNSKGIDWLFKDV